MCCSNAAWKREEVPDHKFDFINVKEFHATNFMTRLQYVWLYILVIKSGAVYIADVYTAVALLASNRWSGSILQSQAAKNGSSVLEVPFSIGKWVFAGCIIFSFLLLLWEARKSRAIIKSRDISYAFTNVMSQNWYSMRSYDHFCFFSQIDNSKKKKDEFAFFIFFTFKGWKRLLLADAPRQVINALTLYSFGSSENWTTDVSVYFGGSVVKAGIIITMLFTLVIWVGSAILLLVAAVMYVPLLCYIQGNLKEYCCHKVDKRIAELMKRKNRKRLAKEAEIARKEAAGDYSHLKNAKTGKYMAAPLPQPTLPKIGLDDDMYAGSDAGSIRGGGNNHYPPNGGWDHKGGAPPGRNPYENQSTTSLANLTHGAAPMGWDSSASLVAGGRPGLRRGMTNASTAPSYRSEDEKGGGYYEEMDDYGAPAMPPRAPEYAPPPRQQLFERSARENESELGYARDDRGQGYGGWEESHQVAVQQEYYEVAPEPQRPRRAPTLDDGNMAGRGAGARPQW